MIDIGLIIQIITMVVAVIQDLWDGPLGDMLKDLLK